MSDINSLRETLFATINGLKDGSVKIETAKAINDTAQTIVNLAKVEVDFLRVNGAVDTKFFHKPGIATPPPQPQPELTKEADKTENNKEDEWQPSLVGGKKQTSLVNGQRVTTHVMK